MPIATINLPDLAAGATSVAGSFTTDALGDVTTTTNAIALSAAVFGVASSADFVAAAHLIDIPGAGPGGALLTIQVTGANLQAANQLAVPNPGIQTAVAAGAVLTRWERLPWYGLPRHVRITRRSNGDYFDWVAGMEPFSANTSIGGVVAPLPKAMLCQPGAGNFAPGILVASQTYDVLLEY